MASKRSHLVGLSQVAATAVLLSGLSACISDSDLPQPPDTESGRLARTVPIADVHMHVYGGPDPEWHLARMNRAGVRWGGGVGGDALNDPLIYKSRLGKRVFPAMGQAEFTAVLLRRGTAGLVDPDEPVFLGLFARAEQAFAQGQVRGFGEIHVDNWGSRGVAASFQRRIPLDNPVTRRMYQIADRHHGFVQIHTMGMADFETWVRLGRDYPNVTTVLSHCLIRSSPDFLRRLFEAVPNLVCEISAQGTSHGGGGRIYGRDGPRPAWRDLIEAHPDRIMLGTDPCCGLEGRYRELVAEMRAYFLPHFRPETLRKLAYRNAQRIFLLED